MNEKIIEKIKGLLALATGETGNAHERELAMRRAQELMAKHAIEESALLEGETTLPVISQKFEPSGLYRINSTLTRWIPYIMTPIAQSFGGFVTFNRTGAATVWGFEPNVKIIQYAANVVLYQGSQDLKREFVKLRQMSFADSFWRGFAIAMVEKFKPKTEGQSSELTIYDPVRAKAMEFGTARPDNYSDASEQGIASGRATTLHKGLTESASSGKRIG
jgi:hypothetical protein